MDLSGEIPVGRKVPSNKEVGWQSQAVNGFKRWIKEKAEDMDVKSNSGRRFLRASLEVGQTKEGKLDEKKRKHGTFHQRDSASGHHCISLPTDIDRCDHLHSEGRKGEMR